MNVALPLGLGALAAFANVFGGLILTGRNWERRYLRYFIALGAGFMLGVTLLELVPESLRLSPVSAPLLLLAGYLLVHLVEHTFVPHFHFGEETHLDRRHLPYSVMLGLGIHTFFDGVAIGSGFLVSAWLGWVLFIAIFLHKVPEGFTMASVMLAAQKSKRAALLASAAVGMASFLGVLCIVLYPVGLPRALPIAAGVTLYVAASDLVPEVNHEPGIRMALCVFLGAAILAVLKQVFG